MISGSWFRMAPEDSSMPLQTMSYCQARMSSGSLRLQRLQAALRHRERVVARTRSSRSPRPSRTSGSRRSSRSGRRPPRSARRAWRPRPGPRAMIFETSSNSPAPKKTRVAGLELQALGQRRDVVLGEELGDRAGQRTASSPTRTQARPLAPCSTAYVAELVEELAGLAGGVRHRQRADVLAGERLEAGAGEDVR